MYFGVKSSKYEFSEFKINFYQVLIPQLYNLPQRFLASLEAPTYFSYTIKNYSCLRLQITISPSTIPIFYSFEDRFPNKEDKLNSNIVSINQCNILNIYDKYNPLACSASQPTDSLTRLYYTIEEISSEQKTIYFSLLIKNSTNIEINVQELTQEDLIPAVILQKKRFFDKIFEFNHGTEILKTQENWKNLKKMTEFTYGEIEFLNILPALEYCKLNEKKVFWDLGCGTGKCLATAAIMFDGLRVKGVEYLETLYLQCSENMEKIQCFPKIEVFLGDLTVVDWSDADVLYCANLCFPESLNLNLVSKIGLLKEGSMVILLKALTIPGFTLSISSEIQMSWGTAYIYIYQKQYQ